MTAKKTFTYFVVVNILHQVHNYTPLPSINNSIKVSNNMFYLHDLVSGYCNFICRYTVFCHGDYFCSGTYCISSFFLEVTICTRSHHKYISWLSSMPTYSVVNALFLLIVSIFFVNFITASILSMHVAFGMTISCSD